jgi:hypothetical protein
MQQNSPNKIVLKKWLEKIVDSKMLLLKWESKKTVGHHQPSVIAKHLCQVGTMKID